MPGKLAAARASREASERSAQLLPRRTGSTQGGLPTELEDAAIGAESAVISRASASRLLRSTGGVEASASQAPSLRHSQQILQQQQQQQCPPLHDGPTSSHSVTFLVSSGQNGQNGTPTATAAAIAQQALSAGGATGGSGAAAGAAAGGFSSPADCPCPPPRSPSTAPLSQPPSAGSLVVQPSGSSGLAAAAAPSATITSPTTDAPRGHWLAVSASSLHQRNGLQWTAGDDQGGLSSRTVPGGGGGISSPSAASPCAASPSSIAAVNAASAGVSSGAAAGSGTSGAATAAAPERESAVRSFQGSIQQPVGAASEQVWTAAAPVERPRTSLGAAMPVRHSRLRVAATASERLSGSWNSTAIDGTAAAAGAATVGPVSATSVATCGSSSRHSQQRLRGAVQGEVDSGGNAGASSVAAEAFGSTVPQFSDLPAPSPENPRVGATGAWTASAALSGACSSSAGGTPPASVDKGSASFIGRSKGPAHNRLTPTGSAGFATVSELFADGGPGREPPSAESSFTVRQTPSDMEDDLLERARARRAIRSLTMANMGMEPRSPDALSSSAQGTPTAGEQPTAAAAHPQGPYGPVARAATAAAVAVDASAPGNGVSRVAIRLNHQPGHHRRPPNRHASMPAMKREGITPAGGGSGGTRKSPLMRPPLSGGLLPEESVPENIEEEDVTSLQYSALEGDGGGGGGGCGGNGGGGDMASGYTRMQSDSPVTSQMSVTSSILLQGPGSTAQQRQLSAASTPVPVGNGGAAATGATAVTSGGGGTGSGSPAAVTLAASLGLAPAQPPAALSRLAAPGFPPGGLPPSLLIRLPDMMGGSSGQRPSFEEDITRPTPAFLGGGSGTIQMTGAQVPANSHTSCAGYVGAAADRPSHMSSRMLSGAHAQTHSSSLAALHKAVEKLMLQDSGLYAKVQASMKGISSLAKETNKLEFVRDASGATVINQYVVVKTLGRGAFGKVKLCLNTLDGQLYAVKMINRAHLLRQLQKPARPLRRRAPPPRNTSDTGLMDLHHRNQNSDGNLSISHTNLNNNFGNAAQAAAPARASMDDTSPLAAIMREIAVMKKVDHPHVVRLHEVIDPPGSSYLMMVMEYCEGGCVMETRQQTGLTPLGEDTAREYFRQACLGLDYLHYNNVVHGDLKPENMLVSGSGLLKIADFGSSRFMGGDPTDATKTSCTPAFQSPEEIGHMLVNPFAADLWALACCLFCFVFGRLPFVGSCVVDIYRAILTRPHVFPEEVSCSPALKDLLDRMLHKDPNKRLKLREVGQHEWVTAGGRLPPLQSLQSLGPAGPGGEARPPVIHVTHAEQVNAIDRSSLVSLVRARLKEKTCQPGEYLFKEGEEAHCVYMIMSGVVELTQHLRRPGGPAGAAAGGGHGCTHGHSVGDVHGVHSGPGGGATAAAATGAHGPGGGGGGAVAAAEGVAAAAVGSELPGGDHDASFSVDLDESLTLDHPDMGQITEAMNIVDGKLHIDRQQAHEIRRRMQGTLLGENAEYVVEVKGPGSVIGEIGLDNAAIATHHVSARARGPVTVVKLTEENFFKALLQMYGEGGGGSAASTTLTASSVSEVVGKGAHGGGGHGGVGGGHYGAAGVTAQHLMVMQYLEDSGSYATFPAPPTSAAAATGVPGRFSMDAGTTPSTLGYRQNHHHAHHYHHHHHQYHHGGNGNAHIRNHSVHGGSIGGASGGERGRSPSPHVPAHGVAAEAGVEAPLTPPEPAAAAAAGSGSVQPTHGPGSVLPARSSGTFAARSRRMAGSVVAGAAGAGGGGGVVGVVKPPDVSSMLGVLNTIHSVNASRGGAVTSEEGVADL